MSQPDDSEPSDSTPPSTPSSRLQLTEEEIAEGWKIEPLGVGGARIKVLDTPKLRRALTLSAPGPQHWTTTFFQRCAERLRRLSWFDAARKQQHPQAPQSELDPPYERDENKRPPLC